MGPVASFFNVALRKYERYMRLRIELRESHPARSLVSHTLQYRFR